MDDPVKNLAGKGVAVPKFRIGGHDVVMRRKYQRVFGALPLPPVQNTAITNGFKGAGSMYAGEKGRQQRNQPLKFGHIILRCVGMGNRFTLYQRAQSPRGGILVHRGMYRRNGRCFCGAEQASAHQHDTG